MFADSKSSRGTLHYFRRAHERDPERFWLPEERTPPGRLSMLVRSGLLERGEPPETDCFRVTQAGLDCLVEG